MTNINTIFSEIAKYRRMQDDVKAELEKLENEVKAHMEAEGIDTLAGDEHKATWKLVVSTRLDSKALKAELPDVAAQFTKTSESMRFTFA